jgi:hypothetical protein
MEFRIGRDNALGEVGGRGCEDQVEAMKTVAL